MLGDEDEDIQTNTYSEQKLSWEYGQINKSGDVVYSQSRNSTLFLSAVCSFVLLYFVVEEPMNMVQPNVPKQVLTHLFYYSGFLVQRIGTHVICSQQKWLY